MIKYFIQFKQTCKACGRSVDVISSDDRPGLMFSRHFVKDKLSFCGNSFGEILR